MYKLENGVPFIQAGGVWRALAALKPKQEEVNKYGAFVDNVSAPDPSTWADCDYSFYKSPIRDQGQRNSCVGYASVTALDITRRMVGDETPELLSSTFVYAQINGNRDQGASVTAGLQELKDIGTCLESECGVNTVFKRHISRSAYETAKKYKIQEAFICRTFEEICEAINRGFPTAFGIKIGRNFNRLSSSGIAPVPDIVVGGHALCGIGLKKLNGLWLVKIQNSWSRLWGLGGYAYLTRDHFDNLVDAYAIMYPRNIDPPPKVALKPRLKIKVEKSKERIAASKEVSKQHTVEGNASLVHTDPDSLVPEKGDDNGKSDS